MAKPTERPKLQLIADGMGAPSRALGYWGALMDQVPDPGEAIAFLRQRIEESTTKLQDALKGFDAFDCLAFLRMTVDMYGRIGWSGKEDLQTNTVAAQEVAAHVLLGMGLPRRPMTGKNPGQPNPDALIRLGASIVEDASAIAIVQGSIASQPLAKLAGSFKAAELTVRGRQYHSVAEDLNTRLLSQPATATILGSVLGFSLADVRAVREAAIELYNRRFFGARDRIGELVQQSQRGITLTSVEQHEVADGTLMMLGECRRYGCVTADDVAATAGITVDTARAVLDHFASTTPGVDAHEMVRRYCQGDRLEPWGCISEGGEYLILDGFLGEDEIRRDLERGLTGSSRWSAYDKKRSTFSESRTVEAIQQLLGGEGPRWQAQDYHELAGAGDPADLSETANLGTVVTKVVESDALFVVDGIALCVEVKAGSITGRARGGDIKRLARDLQKTLQEANEQADRLSKLIRINRGVWGGNGQWVDLSEVREVHSIVVALDDLGPLSLSMSVLVEEGIIDSDEVPWIVTLHDLIVMAKVFDHPAQFVCFLRRRCGRRLATMVSGMDELDLLMWFLNGYMYFDPDPREIAAQLPIDRAVSREAQERFDDQPPVLVGTLTDPLDAWFYFQEGQAERKASKPSRHEADWIEEFLRAAETIKSPGWIRTGADMVSLSPDEQRKRGDTLRYQFREARRLGIERSVTMHAVGDQGPWLLAVIIDPASSQAAREYVRAKKYQMKADRSMLLVYRPNGRLVGSVYDDEPWERSDERDEEVAALPLFSLEASFRPVPPSARRATKRLRGHRRKKD